MEKKRGWKKEEGYNFAQLDEILDTPFAAESLVITSCRTCHVRQKWFFPLYTSLTQVSQCVMWCILEMKCDAISRIHRYTGACNHHHHQQQQLKASVISSRADTPHARSVLFVSSSILNQLKQRSVLRCSLSRHAWSMHLLSARSTVVTRFWPGS